MQLLEILEGLTPAELKKLEQQLKEGSRPHSYLLFRELKKCLGGKQEFDRPKAFKRIYGEKLTDDNDFKLRHETRKLKQVLYQFLVDAAIAKELKEHDHFFNIFLVKALSQRNIGNLFETEYQDALEKALDYMDYDSAQQLMIIKRALWSNQVLKHIEFDHEYFKLYDQFLMTLKKRFLIEMRQHETHWVLTTSNKLVSLAPSLRPEQNQPIPRVERLDLNEIEDDWSRAITSFNVMRYSRFTGSTEEAVFCAHKAIDDLEKIDLKSKEQMRYYLSALSYSVVLLGYNFDFEGALAANEKTYDFAIKYNLKVESEYYLNQVVLLSVLGRMQEVIDFYHEHESAITEMMDFPLSVSNICYAYLSLDRSNEAIAHLREVRQTFGQSITNRFEGLIRYVYVIAYIIDKQYEDALRELDNFRKSKMMEHVPDPDRVIEMINIYRRYIRLKMEPYTDHKEDFQAMLHQLKGMDPIVLIQSPVYRWIKQRLEHELS